MRSVFLGFTPWILFAVISGPSTWTWASLAALIAALIIAIPDARHTRGVGVLDAAAIGFFAVLTVLALVLGRSALQPLEDRAQLLSSAVLAMVALGSVVVGKPFTVHYARQSAPPDVWSSPTFRRINVVLSLLWAAVFAVTALFDLAALRWDDDLFNWVLPAVVVVAAVKFTGWYAEHAARRRVAAGPEAGVTSSGSG
jgi:hypothetical protein